VARPDWGNRQARNFTGEDELLVIVPDLHVPLYAGQVVDRFRFAPDPSAPEHMRPLDDELARLLMVAAQMSATTIQVGDLYEVWDSEILLRLQYRELLGIREEVRSLSARDDALRPDIRKMLVEGKIVPRDVSIHPGKAISPGGPWERGLPLQLVEERGVALTETDAIISAIRKVHPSLFGSKERLFDFEIRGNHDNRLRNNDWAECAPDGFRLAEAEGGYLTRSTSASSGGKWTKTLLNEEIGAPTHPIWIEHGHVYDWHNNDIDWWKAAHGFDMVVGFVAERMQGVIPSEWLGKRSSDGGQYAEGIADWFVRFRNYTMRQAGQRRVDEIITRRSAVGGLPEAKVPRGDHVRLVVMGHTHGPEIIEGSCRSARGPLDPGWEQYRTGSYWYETADDRLVRQKREQAQREALDLERRARIEKMFDRR
jgi:hypothetical protein